MIFQRDDAARAAEIDKSWKALDPKATNFPQKVDELLMQLSSSETDQLRKKVALLSFLAERDLTPTYPGEFSRIALEVNSLLWRFDALPDGEAVLPPVCEYLVTRYPRDQGVMGQCKLLLKILDERPRQDMATRRRDWLLVRHSARRLLPSRAAR